MEKLEFMIVGAQKCGTTALAGFLGQHPDICMSIPKETHFFDSADYTPDFSERECAEYYAPFFRHHNAESMKGEATPVYFYWPEIAPQLQRYNPRLKLVLILRDPVERAISHWQMESERGEDWLPMAAAFLVEPLRVFFSRSRSPVSSRRLHSYLGRGRYGEQLRNLRSYFPDEQILVLENKELLLRQEETLKLIFGFLGVGADVRMEPGEAVSVRTDDPGARGRVYRRLLRFYYQKSNRVLRSELAAMGVQYHWDWLQ